MIFFYSKSQIIDTINLPKFYIAKFYSYTTLISKLSIKKTYLSLIKYMIYLSS
jgi:hypothetical protein